MTKPGIKDMKDALAAQGVPRNQLYAISKDELTALYQKHVVGND